jgi:hypothetical protein
VAEEAVAAVQAVWLTAAPALLPRSSHRWWLAVNVIGALAINHFILTNW